MPMIHNEWRNSVNFLMCPYLAFDYELAPSRLHNVSSWMQGNRKEIYIYATAVIICKEQFEAEDLKKDKKSGQYFWH